MKIGNMVYSSPPRDTSELGPYSRKDKSAFLKAIGFHKTKKKSKKIKKELDELQLDYSHNFNLDVPVEYQNHIIKKYLPAFALDSIKDQTNIQLRDESRRYRKTLLAEKSEKVITEIKKRLEIITDELRLRNDARTNQKK